ncbi:AEC family transporter [Butyricicoccus sp.]|uniref:AEC family transporter n=1 Tax=Butyricicoccus sp. TaxID=2049021 RepID=UPI003F183119
MSTVLFKALAFVLMIALGYFSKASHLLQQEDSQILMKIIINITMPMALIAGFRTFSFDTSLLFALVIGFGFNLVLLAAGWLLSARRDGTTRALYVLNVPSYNIGNFALPFVQGFLPASATLCLCMFDAGNNPMGAGITYSAAASLTGGDGRLSLRDILRKLFRSPPFLAYFIMLVLYLPGIRLPDAFFDMCALFGQGNTFLAMFTLGLIFEWHLPREDIREVLRILGIRYALCLLAAAAVYLLTPFDLVTRQTLCLCLVAPVTTLSVAYGLACGCKHSMIAALSSVSMAVSFVLSLGLLILWA